jgi:cytochrome c oxidase subunit II
MKIHTYEKAFLSAGGIVLVVCMAALVYATLGMGLHLPGAVGQIDPRDVPSTPPFDQPGVREIAPGRYEAAIVARAWNFQPAEIRVPVDADIVFTVTSVDVLHGFNVEGTRLNLMLVPGQISRNEYRFTTPGEYLIICHEYCGIGHHMMSGKVIVEESATAAAESVDPDPEI